MTGLPVAPMIAVVMGVEGSGKTTVAALLAAALHCEFQEGDLLHPPENIQKMHSGTPLGDADRMIWLQRVAGAIDAWRSKGVAGVISCSALKRSYRDIIIGGRENVTLVYLKGSPELIRSRLLARHGHFMPVSLLDSQFVSLEEPTPDELPIIASVDGTPGAIAAGIAERLKERAAELGTSGKEVRS